MARLVQLTAPVIDLLYRVRAVPLSGEEAVVSGFEQAVGGGFNAMYAARRGGIGAALAGTLGTGPFADIVSARLAAEGMEILGPRHPARDQGNCVVMIEPSGERSFVAAPGAEGEIAPGDLEALDLKPDDRLLLSGYTLLYPGSGAAVASWIAAAELPPLVFDPSPLVGELPPERLETVMARAAWVSANGQEAAILTGEEDPIGAARLLAEGRPGGALVRLGARGCILATGRSLLDIPAPRVEVLDSNGAGDTHIGAFIAALALGAAPAEAARLANAAAALSITRFGPATAPGRRETEAFLSQGTASWPPHPEHGPRPQHGDPE